MLTHLSLCSVQSTNGDIAFVHRIIIIFFHSSVSLPKLSISIKLASSDNVVFPDECGIITAKKFLFSTTPFDKNLKLGVFEPVENEE
jgi:hypothetical protein